VTDAVPPAAWIAPKLRHVTIRRPPTGFVVWLIVLSPLIVWFLVAPSPLAAYLQIVWTAIVIVFLYARRFARRFAKPS